MKSKPYADTCLERASMATEGPWKVITCKSLEDADFICEARTDVPELARRLKKACEALRAYCTEKQNAGGKMTIKVTDEAFMCPQCGQDLRLPPASEALRDAQGKMDGYTDGRFGKLADELEAMPEA